MEERLQTLANRLLRDHSKHHIEMLAKELADNPEYFDDLMTLFFRGPYRVTQWSSHLVSKCCDLRPNLIMPYMGKMIDLLVDDTPDAVKRNIVRTMQFAEIPEEHWDKAVSHCFRMLQSKNEAIAVKVFAMTVLAHLCEKLPDLKNELILTIEDQLPYGSAGFVSRGTKILKKMKQGNCG